MSRPALASAVADSLKRKMALIGTHSGTFHCDEALGCYLLRQTEAFKGAEVVRTRNPDVLKDLHVVIDVGGVYDPSESPSQEPGARVPAAASPQWLQQCSHLTPTHPKVASKSFALLSSGANRFDHHQRGFEEVFGHGFNTKLSSAGLV
jgi:uncharacterized UPF0160 family protein